MVWKQWVLPQSLCLKQFSMEEIKSEKFHDNVASVHDSSACLYFMRLYLLLTFVHILGIKV